MSGSRLENQIRLFRESELGSIASALVGFLIGNIWEMRPCAKSTLFRECCRLHPRGPWKSIADSGVVCEQPIRKLQRLSPGNLSEPAALPTPYVFASGFVCHPAALSVFPLMRIAGQLSNAANRDLQRYGKDPNVDEIGGSGALAKSDRFEIH